MLIPLIDTLFDYTTEDNLPGALAAEASSPLSRELQMIQASVQAG